MTRSTMTLAATLLVAAATTADEPKVLWRLTEGVKAPESAYLDADSGFLFLSQIGEGGGMKKDGVIR